MKQYTILRVADYHTYFVGGGDWNDGIWAHNAACIDIALGLTDSLTSFRDSVAPAALIYDQWQSQNFVPSGLSFGQAYAQAIDKARYIYFNLAGITNVSQAVIRGRKGYNVGFTDQSTNYTNYELYTLSMKVGFNATDNIGHTYESKIKWYDGTTPTSEPSGFGNMWNPALYR